MGRTNNSRVLCYTTCIMGRIRPSKPKNILLILWVTESSGRDFLAGFSRYVHRKKDWNVHLLFQSEDFLPDTVRDIRSGVYDGIVMTENTFFAHPEFGECPETAIVLFGVPAPGHTRPGGRIVYVQYDDGEIGRCAARHFMQLGNFRTIAFVPPPHDDAWVRLRYAGFADELGKHGFVAHAFDYSQPLAAWLCGLPKPAAIMAASDYTAVEVAATCNSNAIAIPQEVALVGVDNDELLCEFTRPSLSSIRQNNDKSGQLAAQELDRLFRRRAVPGRLRVVPCSDCTVVCRESSRPVAPATHLILSAISYIRANVTRNLSAADVVKHLGVSRSLADLRFRQYQGETILETITRIRLEELSKRLLVSNLPVGKVAATMGFDDLSYLGRIFRRRFGQSMVQWRANGAG